jgi:orotate phosphoribosyltransferase
MPHEELDNLWLARTLFDLGAIRFGDFTLGRSTVNSPVYVDLRVLLGQPGILRYSAQLIQRETAYGQMMRHRKCEPFDLVSGVPFGGLHLATAFSLATDVPMIYSRPGRAQSDSPAIEGIYTPNQHVLVIDDLATSGGSLLQTIDDLHEASLIVTDAIVLVDRERGTVERLRQRGVRLTSILKLQVMLNLYMSSGLIDEETYTRCVRYLGQPGDRT